MYDDWDDDWDDDPLHADLAEREPVSLGPCCICGVQGSLVRTIMMFERRSPSPGKGWGCVICDLPPDGAYAVLCDPCLARGGSAARIDMVCTGWPAEDGRTPLDMLDPTPFTHNRLLHETAEAYYG